MPMRISSGAPMIGSASTTIGPARSMKRMIVKPPIMPVKVNSDCVKDATAGLIPWRSITTGSQLARKKNPSASQMNSSHRKIVAGARGPLKSCENVPAPRLLCVSCASPGTKTALAGTGSFGMRRSTSRRSFAEAGSVIAK